MEPSSGTAKTDATAPPGPQAIEGLLKELLGARKAFKLYPASNPVAADWLHRVVRAVEGLVGQGPPLRLRVTQTGFEWDGGQFVPRDRALEAFRFELATRKITEITIAAGVEAWELRELLDVLNNPGRETAAGEGEAERGLAAASHIALGGSLSRYGQAVTGTTAVAGELLDLAVDETLDALQEVIREVTFDRLRLAAWFHELTRAGEETAVPLRVIQMLIPLIELEPDREGRYRTLVETLMALPDPLRITLVRAGLMPAVRADVNVIKLFTRLSADELAELAGLIPAEDLRTFRADIEAAPVEEWTKTRMGESLEDVLNEKEVAATPLEPLIAEDDPILVQFREWIQTSCAPDRVLEHSVAVLYALAEETESETYPTLLMDALEEAITEALRLDQLALALRTLQWIARPEKLRSEWQAEHQRRALLLRRRLAGRAPVTLLAECLRRSDAAERGREAAEYLRALDREALAEFVGILGDEADEGIRGRMLSALAGLGADAIPAARARLADPRWVVVRSMVTLLTEIGDATALEAITKVAAHPHPQVRREVARALSVLGGRQAARWILGYLADADPEVRRTALKAIQGLVSGGAVAPVRDFLVSPARTTADLLVRREMITTLASSGRPEATEILASIARRWLWPWQGSERKVRAMARAALQDAGGRPAPAPPARSG